MIERTFPSIRIDLNEFKLHLHLRSRTKLTLHFDSPSRRFYLTVIALVVHEMKRSGEIKSIPLLRHLDMLALLNESIGGAAGSSGKENLLHRIYAKWKDALPNLEKAPLFKVLGRMKEGEVEGIGKAYLFKEADQDDWANLFEYMGSNENVRLRFAVDKIGIGLDKTAIVFDDAVDGEAWNRFVSSLNKDREEGTGPAKGLKEKETTEGRPVVTPTPAPPSLPQEPRASWFKRYRWVLRAVVIVIVLAGIGAVYWNSTRTTVASPERMKFPLPDKPSIAVLPFVNMSEDPKQEYFSDGITEEIITALSKLPNLFVIARNSTFYYKGKAVKVNQVAEELGVRYVLEGSVRKTNEKVRISAQLVDALSGHHLWAERYDRDLKDIFALQDEITLKIITSLQVKLTAGEQARLAARGTTSLEAYIKAMQYREQFQRITKEGRDAAKKLAEEIVALDPGYARAYVFLAGIHNLDFILGLSDAPRHSLAQASKLLNTALSLDDSLSHAHVALAQTYLYSGQHDKGLAEARKAVALDPNSSESLSFLAWVYCHVGRAEEAIPLVEAAARLDPVQPPVLVGHRANAYRVAGRYEKAIEVAKRALRLEPKYLFVHFNLIASFIALGREEEARADAAELLRMYPKEHIEKVVGRMPFKDRAENDRLMDALRKAGIQ
ncbi:MAG: tetratricopeptide repeat protein [Deltaproteobacteria bacterium]|nr:tetratricopeptide repeat protein [Deltaproteobacteria bacterium]